MENLLSTLDKYSKGVSILIVLLFTVIILVQWLFYIFGIGRYKSRPDGKGSGSFMTVLTDLLVKIINDFRHFLALILVLIFAVALGVALYTHSADLDELTGALQAVMATLGGLIGSIVGYYFGESAALRVPEKILDEKSSSASTEAVQKTKTEINAPAFMPPTGETPAAG